MRVCWMRGREHKQGRKLRVDLGDVELVFTRVERENLLECDERQLKRSDHGGVL